MNTSTFQFPRWIILSCFLILLIWIDSVHSMFRMKDVRSRIPGFKSDKEYRSLPFNLPWASETTERFQGLVINRANLEEWLAFLNTHSNVYEEQKKFIIKGLGDLLDFFDRVKQNSNDAASLEAAQSTSAKKKNDEKEVTARSSLLNQGKYDVILKTLKMISGVDVKWLSEVNVDFYFKNDQAFPLDFGKDLKEACTLLLRENRVPNTRNEIESNGLKLIFESSSLKLRYLPLVNAQTQENVLKKVKNLPAPLNKIRPSQLVMFFSLLNRLQVVQILDNLFSTLSTKGRPKGNENEIYGGFFYLNEATFQYDATNNQFKMNARISASDRKEIDNYEEVKENESKTINDFITKLVRREDVAHETKKNALEFLTALQKHEELPFKEMDALILSFTGHVPAFGNLVEKFTEHELAHSFRVILMESFWNVLERNDGRLKRSYGDMEKMWLHLPYSSLQELKFVFKTRVPFEKEIRLNEQSHFKELQPLYEPWYKLVQSYYVSRIIKYLENTQKLLRIARVDAPNAASN